MEESYAVRIGDESGVGAARREAARIGRAVGLDVQTAGRLAIVATELGENVWKHAGGGELVLRALDGGVELLALDKGPGMADVGRAMGDGYSTKGTAGTGLGAVRRQSQLLDIYTRVGAGTAVLARVMSAAAATSGGAGRAAAPSRVTVGGVCLPKPGEEVPGDSWTVARAAGRTVVLVADGLGHGPDAAVAARAATRLVADCVRRPPAELLARAHEAMRGTRGAAVAVAAVDEDAGELVFAGIGNVAAHLVHADGTTMGLPSSYGTVGGDLRKIQEQRAPLAAGDGLLLATDGVRPRWRWSDYPALWRRDPALVAGIVYRDFAAGRDDATVVVAGVT